MEGIAKTNFEKKIIFFKKGIDLWTNDGTYYVNYTIVGWPPYFSQMKLWKNCYMQISTKKLYSQKYFSKLKLTKFQQK